MNPFPPDTTGQSTLLEYITFRRMITPLIIQIIFWIGVALSVIGGLIMIVAGATADFGGGMMVVSGLLQLFLGPLLVRIWCELIIIFFRINETLIDIRNNAAGR